MNKQKLQGVTLTEMLVAVIVLGILAAVVLPSYQRHIENTNLRNAQSALLDVANKVKIEQVRNPDFLRTLGTTPINISGNTIQINTLSTNIDSTVTQRYTIESSLIERKGIQSASNQGVSSGNAGIVIGFRLLAIPTTQSGFTKAAWVDNSGAAYTCTSASAARAFQKTGDCMVMTK